MQRLGWFRFGLGRQARTAPAGRTRVRGGLTVPVAAIAGLVSWILPGPPPYDLKIVRARVMDGSGGAWYRADVGVRNGRIARIGALDGAPAARTIDAEDRILAPGFIDVHVHVEENLPPRPDAENLVADGVTSVVTGNCGASELDLADWFRALEKSGIAINVASLVGHNAVRAAVMGHENRAASPGELLEMEALVEKGMRDGAVGFSTGLIYSPGTFAGSDEIVSLARVAARFGGIYATHMRSENDRIFAAIDEALAVARRARVPLEISHYKVTSRRLWGMSRRMLEIVDAARREGLDVTLDQYPYAASSSGLEVLLPDWALESAGSARHALLRRLKDPRERRRVHREMRRRLAEDLGREHLDYAVVASAPWDRSLEGRSVRAINRDRGLPDDLASQIETALVLCERGAESGRGGICGTQMVYHVMDEGDVDRIFASPLTMVARDGGVERDGSGRPHPRSFGTSARVLARFVRERGVVPLEEAVRKMTSLPAQRFGFGDRGLVKEGFRADLLLFDPEEVEDRSTFEDPHRLSAGFDLVMVNGVIVREHGVPTCERPGMILRGKAVSCQPSAISSQLLSSQFVATREPKTGISDSLPRAAGLDRDVSAMSRRLMRAGIVCRLGVRAAPSSSDVVWTDANRTEAEFLPQSAFDEAEPSGLSELPLSPDSRKKIEARLAGRPPGNFASHAAVLRRTDCRRQPRRARAQEADFPL